MHYPVGVQDSAAEVCANGSGELGPAVRLGLPEVLFRSPFELRTAPQRNFDMLPDGRFVMVGRADDVERPGLCITSSP